IRAHVINPHSRIRITMVEQFAIRAEPEPVRDFDTFGQLADPIRWIDAKERANRRFTLEVDAGLNIEADGAEPDATLIIHSRGVDTEERFAVPFREQVP